MGCDLCGKDLQLYETRIEGTVMTVCDTCKGHGEVIRRVPGAQEKRKQERRGEREERPAYVATSREVMLLVRAGFGPLIKAARERRDMKQEDLAKRLRIKESQLHAYENGHHKPDLETARLLEKALHITLVEEHVEEHGATRGSAASGPLTIADLLKKR